MTDSFLHVLPSDHRKPDPNVIGDIIQDYRVTPEETLYVGDSITKDIMMAKSAGIRSAWARYGTKFDRALWEKLVRITHWTESDVKREEVLRSLSKEVAADVNLDSFMELNEYFTFGAPAKVPPVRRVAY